MAGDPGSTYTPIYAGRDFFVPAFEVKIRGVSLDATVLRDVIEITYTDTVDKFDTFEITVNNWDDVRRDFKYTGPANGEPDPDGRDELFDPGQDIEIWMGYFAPTEASKRDPNKPEPLRLMTVGMITKLEPTFPAAGQPTLKVSGQNALVKMVGKQETYDYKAGMGPSEIAEAVGKRGNLMVGNMKIPVRVNDNAKANEAKSTEAVLQANQYDIIFLLMLARKNGYDLYMAKEEKNGTTETYLNFGPSDKLDARYLLEWGRSIVEFQPTLTIMKQVSELTVRGWDVNTKKEIKETVKRKDLPVQGMSDADRLARIEQAFNVKQEIVVDRPFHSKEEARKYATAMLQDLSKSLVTAKGGTFGTPDLHAGRKVKITGLGRTFDGEYFLTSTTHTIGSGGYITRFEARLEED